MRRSLLALSIAVLGCMSAFAEDDLSDVNVLGRKLQFVAEVSAYQGMFDSVIEFCRPHSPPYLVKLTEELWLRENGSALSLRDKEFDRVLMFVRTSGVEPAKISEIEGWQAKYYNRARQSDRLYKDIRSAESMSIACSKRLGNMSSRGMQLQDIAPAAYEYAQHAPNP